MWKVLGLQPDVLFQGSTQKTPASFHAESCLAGAPKTWGCFLIQLGQQVLVIATDVYWAYTMCNKRCIKWSSSIGHITPFYQWGLENTPKVPQQIQGGVRVSLGQSDLRGHRPKAWFLEGSLIPSFLSQGKSGSPFQPEARRCLRTYNFPQTSTSETLLRLLPRPHLTRVCEHPHSHIIDIHISYSESVYQVSRMPQALLRHKEGNRSS